MEWDIGSIVQRKNLKSWRFSFLVRNNPFVYLFQNMMRILFYVHKDFQLYSYLLPIYDLQTISLQYLPPKLYLINWLKLQSISSMKISCTCLMLLDLYWNVLNYITWLYIHIYIFCFNNVHDVQGPRATQIEGYRLKDNGMRICEEDKRLR